MNRALALVLRGLALVAILAVGPDAPVRAAPQPGPTTSLSRAADAVEILPLIDGDDLRFTRLSTAQGLSQTRVDHIVQDDRGFMWFATQYGVNRYDSYSYKIFTHDAARETSLSCVYIRSLFKDRSGTLWVGCDQFLDRYDAATETFTHYRLGNRGNDQPPVRVFSISQDRTEAIWLSTDDGLYRLDSKTGRMAHFGRDASNPASLSSNEVQMTGEDRDGRFWVSDGGMIEEFDRNNGRVIRRIRVAESGFPPVLFLEDHFGVFWVMYVLEGRDSGLAVLDRATNRLTRFDIRERDSGRRITVGIYDGVEEQNHTIWFATYGAGLLRLDRDRRTLVRYRNHPNDLESIAEDRVIALATDREGNIWTGLHAMPPNVFHSKPSFMPLLRNPANPNSFGEAFINAIHEDRQGVLWTSMTGALVRTDRETGRNTLFHPPGPENGRDIISITQDTSGALWLGTRGGGLSRFDYMTGRFTTYRHTAGDPSSLSHDVVSRLLIDRKGRFWVATWDGLDLFDPATGRFVVYKNVAEDVPELFYNVIEDRDGLLWLGGSAGLSRFDPSSGKFKVYSHFPGDPKSLSDNTVTSVLVDRAGAVWASTENGLNRLDPTTRTFVAYHARDGLPSDAVSCVLEDSSGKLWMSTTRGLSRFDPATRTFRNYSTADGVPGGGDLTGWDACFKSRTGEMFFGGFSGGVAFHPERVIDRLNTPPIVLTDFQVSGHPVPIEAESPLKRSITYTDAVTLTHAQNVFSLSFVALSYVNPSAIRYRYRLDGIDPDWVDVGNDRRTVTYTTLPAGEYTFRAQVAGPGVWGNDGVALHVTVLPAWWATVWFRTLVALAGAALLWTMHVVRLRRASAEIRARLEERFGERERIARELHDTVLQGAYGLILRFQAVAERMPSSDPTRDTIEDTLVRAERVIAEGRMRVDGLRTQADDGRGLQTALSGLAKEVEPGSEAEVRVFSEGRPRTLHTIVRDEVYWIAREAIVNALRSAHARMVEVELSYRHADFCVRIRDDGRGIDPALLEAGGRPGHWGIRGMKERARRIGAAFDIWTGAGVGTEVSLKIPGAVAYREPPTRSHRWWPRWPVGRSSTSTELE
jgi:ligand-binding sensor domain-containing protein/signal transduction histidine kinase